MSHDQTPTETFPQPFGEHQLEEQPREEQAVVEPQLERQPFEEPQLEEQPFEEQPFEDQPFGEPRLDDQPFAEQPFDEHEIGGPAPRSRLADFRERIARAMAGFDRGHVESTGVMDEQETEAYDVVAEVSDAPRFPVGALGYSRAVVDAHVAELERELTERRDAGSSISINEEIARLGEQTASILVVAHDKAHETARLAQEQADRCVADAASNAVAITEQAKRQLRALDMETDTVWQERTRLLEDARSVGEALIALADRAATRFPEELKPSDVDGQPAARSAD